MDQYSDQEQLDAIRKWWSENGKAIVGGLLLGLGGVLGWQFWQDHQRNAAEQASAHYFQLAEAVSADDVDGARLKAVALREEYPRSPYAALAGLVLAAEDIKADNLDGARTHLLWVIENARQPELSAVARLRLARVLMAKGEYATAISRLDEVGPPYRAEADEIRGDIHVRQGEPDRAREAYEAARAAVVIAGGSNQWLEMKLNELNSAGTKDPVTETMQ